MSRSVYSLRSRLILLIVTAMVPAIALILDTAAKHRELTVAQIKQNALVAARVIASEQDRALENAHQFLVTIARLPQIRGNDRAACRNLLAGLLEPRYADLAVSDRRGNLVCTALGADSPVANPKGLHHLRSIERFDFAVGDIRRHPAGAKLLWDVSYPVLEQSGNVRAVVSAALDVSWINFTAVDTHLYPGASFTLFRADGKVLLRHPGGLDWTGESLISDDAPLRTVFPSADRTLEAAGPDGIRRLFAFSRLKTPVGGQAVYAAVDLPVEILFDKTRKILTQNLLALGVLAAIILAFTWFGTDLLVLRRIRDIVAATKQVAGGNLGARTTLAYDRSELGQMASAFDHLAEALEKREADAAKTAQQIARHRQQQEALYDLNRGITSTLDLASVLSTLLEHVSALFPAYAVNVSWINARTRNLETIAYRGAKDTERTDGDMASEQSLAQLVLKQQTPVAVSNARTDPRTAHNEFFSRQPWTSYLGFPLIAKEDILGVLSFYSQQEHEFTPEEMSFLNALVNEAAIAIYNSRLFQQTVEQTLELAQSNKIKDEFLGVMSHELRTPLNIIMNYSEALKMGAFGEIGPDQERGTEKIRTQAGHLLTLINGILEITKIDSGSVTVQADPIDLEEFLCETKSDYALPISNTLAMHWDFDPRLPVIISDRVKLKQIVANIINNAIKFTEAGSVAVSAHMADNGNTLQLTVADTGPGIPKELQGFVFDKFRQLDSATTRNYSGAGLGLYIVKHFVDLLGGTIEVQSELGQGSVFCIRLPIQHGSMSDQTVGAPPKSAATCMI
jgi:signal transduction histidine kinase/HAMP domain-containing protein